MVISDPRVMSKFSTIQMNDTIQEITFELKNSVNEFADKEFVIKLLSLGMSIEWLRPKVDSVLYTSMYIGGKEEKILLNNYKPMTERLKRLESQFSTLLSQYSYINNSYVRGDR